MVDGWSFNGDREQLTLYLLLLEGHTQLGDTHTRARPRCDDETRVFSLNHSSQATRCDSLELLVWTWKHDGGRSETSWCETIRK